MAVVRAVRNLRAELKVELRKEVDVLIAAPAAVLAVLRDQQAIMEPLAKMKITVFAEALTPPKGAMAALAGQAQVFLPVEGLLDLDVERQRLAKEQDKLKAQLDNQHRKLSNEAYVSKAPPHLVQVERDKIAEIEAALVKLAQSLQELGARA